MGKHRRRRNILYRAYMLCKAIIAQLRYGFPARDIICVGITGTDGKSTTSEMTYHVLKQAGYKVALLSTTSIDVGDGKKDNLSKLTSLRHMHFARLCAQAKKHGCTHMVVEVSSHALYQFRTWPLHFVGVALTNLSREHLDFHKTMEEYASTKCKLFKRLLPDGIALLPDNFAYRHLLPKLAPSHKLTTFGYEQNCDIYVDQITQTPEISCTMHMKDISPLPLKTLLIGGFNMENMMIAASLATHLGVTDTDIIQALESFRGIPGRQERIATKQGITAMIDFALTPDALETIYTAARDMGYKRVLAVFGATGNRDQGKRPLMGEVATRLCDRVVFTEDENYHEAGEDIIAAIIAGVDQEYADVYKVVQDRSEAIYAALQEAKPGDIVVITGMANFTTRMMNNGAQPWNEKVVIMEHMQTLGLDIL